MLGGAERQAAARGQIEYTRVAAYLGDDRGKAATAQPFLENPQRIRRPGHAHYDQARWPEAKDGEAVAVGEAGFIGCLALENPEDRARVVLAEPCEDGGGKAVIAAASRLSATRSS